MLRCTFSPDTCADFLNLLAQSDTAAVSCNGASLCLHTCPAPCQFYDGQPCRRAVTLASLRACMDEFYTRVAPIIYRASDISTAMRSSSIGGTILYPNKDLEIVYVLFDHMAYARLLQHNANISYIQSYTLVADCPIQTHHSLIFAPIPLPVNQTFCSYRPILISTIALALSLSSPPRAFLIVW